MHVHGEMVTYMKFVESPILATLESFVSESKSVQSTVRIDGLESAHLSKGEFEIYVMSKGESAKARISAVFEDESGNKTNDDGKVRGHHTAMARRSPSAPTRWLAKNALLLPPIFDYGCGKGVDADFLGADRWDPAHSPDTMPKKAAGRYKTVICTYVLNVVDEKTMSHILREVDKLLSKDGKAYFAVRRDLPKSVSEAIKFHDDLEDRPHGHIQSHISGKKDPYTSIGALDAEDVETLAGEQFSKLAKTVRRRHGGIPLNAAVNATMRDLSKLIDMEEDYRSQLEELAIRTVSSNFKIPKGSLKFDVKITGTPVRDSGKLKAKPTVAKEMEHLSDERAKRRLLNGLVQGAASKANHLHHMAADELGDIDDQLADAYSKLMDTNEVLYWMFDPKMLEMAERSGKAGDMSVDFSTKPPTVKARGIVFPVLVHELVKGVMEYLVGFGIPQDHETAKKVLSAEDSLEQERWDLRVGPEIWNRFLDILTKNGVGNLMAPIISNLAELPAKDAVRMISDIAKGKNTPEFKKFVHELRMDLEDEKKSL